MNEEKDKKEEMDYERREQLYRHYEAQRDEAQRTALEISGRAARLTMTISGGALVLSITFLNNITQGNYPQWPWILAISWGALALSVILLTWCQMRSQESMEYEVEYFNRKMGDPDEEYEGETNPHNKAVRWMRKSSLHLSFLGIVMLGMFAFVNVIHAEPTQESHVAKPNILSER